MQELQKSTTNLAATIKDEILSLENLISQKIYSLASSYESIMTKRLMHTFMKPDPANHFSAFYEELKKDESLQFDKVVDQYIKSFTHNYKVMINSLQGQLKKSMKFIIEEKL